MVGLLVLLPAQAGMRRRGRLIVYLFVNAYGWGRLDEVETVDSWLIVLSGYRIAGVLPALRHVKCQHNLVLWYPLLHQRFGNTFLGTITLNPDFSGDNLYMDEAAMYAPARVPAHIQEYILVRGAIQDQPAFDLPIRIRDLAVFCE
jgi:hypothetical protein